MLNLNNKTLISSFEKILKIRSAENLLAENKKKGIIDSPVHLAAGQEAIAVSLANFKLKGDVIFGNHRSHHHILSLNTDLTKFFKEILCKKDGLSNGYGGSMHLVDKKAGFYGSVPIVTGSLSIATGAAFALKTKNKKNVAISYFGDGATEEGVMHESLLFASKNELPLIYALENNEYSSNIHISQRHNSNNLVRFAKSHGISSKILDGNNFIELTHKLKKIFSYVRDKRKPYFLEFKTYRFYGHVDWREDIDVGVERSKKKLESWKKKDPIIKLEEFILKKGLLSNTEINNKKRKIYQFVNKSWNDALRGTEQSKKDLLKFVYHE